MAGFDLQLDNDGTYSVATFFYFCVQIGIGLVVLFRYMVMRPVDMKKILFVFLIIGSFVIARRYSGADALLETRLLIAGANDIDYRKILKVYLIVEIPMIICTMIVGYTGVITNLVYHRGDQVRMSFGFIYPTDFAAGIVFMITVWIVLRQARCTWIEIGMMIISVVLFEKYCDVRNSEIVMMILIICVVYLKIRSKERKGIYTITITKNFMSGGTIWFSWIYDLSIKILSTRYRMDGKIKYSFFNETFFRKRSF